MELAKLPNELLAAICRSLCPDTPSNDPDPIAALANLARTCRQFKDLATPYLYQRLQLGPRTDSLACLRTLHNRPDLADLVRVVEIYDREVDNQDYDLVLVGQVAAKLNLQLRDYVSISCMKSQDFQAQLLVTLTSKVERVHYQEQPFPPPFVGFMADLLQDNPWLQASSLSNLKCFSTGGRLSLDNGNIPGGVGRPARYQLQCFFEGSQAGLPNNNITVLNLTNSAATAALLAEMTTAFPRLTQFGFRAARVQDSRKARPSQIVPVLTGAYGQQLTRLDLDFWDGQRGRLRSGPDYDFTSYSALKELALDFEALTGKKGRGLRPRGQSNFLIDMLPPQIEALDIHGYEPRENGGQNVANAGRSPLSRCLIDNLLREKARFPQLELVRLNGEELYRRQGATAHRPLPLALNLWDAFLA